MEEKIEKRTAVRLFVYIQFDLVIIMNNCDDKYQWHTDGVKGGHDAMFPLQTNSA